MKRFQVYNFHLLRFIFYQWWLKMYIKCSSVILAVKILCIWFLLCKKHNYFSTYICLRGLGIYSLSCHLLGESFKHLHLATKPIHTDAVHNILSQTSKSTNRNRGSKRRPENRATEAPKWLSAPPIYAKSMALTWLTCTCSSTCWRFPWIVLAWATH